VNGCAKAIKNIFGVFVDESFKATPLSHSSKVALIQAI
jgi:hypothetical protein